jgi:hypothetical protein
MEPNSIWRGKLEALRFDDHNERWRHATDYDGLSLVQSLQKTELGRLGYLD